MKDLSNNQKLVVFGGAALLVDSFLPWYGFSAAGLGGFNINAWDVGFLAWGGVLLVVAGAVVVYLKASGTKNVEAGNMAPEQLALVLAGIGTVLILLRLLPQTSLAKFGLFLGVLLAVVATYGAFQNTKEAGLEIPGSDVLVNLRSGDDDDNGGSS